MIKILLLICYENFMRLLNYADDPQMNYDVNVNYSV